MSAFKGVKKIVPRGTIFCPDCKHALVSIGFKNRNIKRPDKNKPADEYNHKMRWLDYGPV